MWRLRYIWFHARKAFGKPKSYVEPPKHRVYLIGGSFDATEISVTVGAERIVVPVQLSSGRFGQEVYRRCHVYELENPSKPCKESSLLAWGDHILGKSE